MVATRTRFEVIVLGKDGDGKPTRQRISTHARPDSALGRLVDIIKQWAASHGAVTPGTTVKIIDMVDGGTFFEATYLGYEPDSLFSGRQ